MDYSDDLPEQTNEDLSDDQQRAYRTMVVKKVHGWVRTFGINNVQRAIAYADIVQFGENLTSIEGLAEVLLQGFSFPGKLYSQATEHDVIDSFLSIRAYPDDENEDVYQAVLDWFNQRVSAIEDAVQFFIEEDRKNEELCKRMNERMQALGDSETVLKLNIDDFLSNSKEESEPQE